MNWQIEDKQGDLYEQLQKVKKSAKKDAAQAKTREENKKLHEQLNQEEDVWLEKCYTKKDHLKCCNEDGSKTRKDGCPCNCNTDGTNCTGEFNNGNCIDSEWFGGGKRKKSRRKRKRKRRTKKKKNKKKNKGKNKQ